MVKDRSRLSRSLWWSWARAIMLAPVAIPAGLAWLAWQVMRIVVGPRIADRWRALFGGDWSLDG